MMHALIEQMEHCASKLEVRSNRLCCALSWPWDRSAIRWLRRALPRIGHRAADNAMLDNDSNNLENDKLCYALVRLEGHFPGLEPRRCRALDLLGAAMAPLWRRQIHVSARNRTTRETRRPLPQTDDGDLTGTIRYRICAHGTRRYRRRRLRHLVSRPGQKEASHEDRDDPQAGHCRIACRHVVLDMVIACSRPSAPGRLHRACQCGAGASGMPRRRDRPDLERQAS